MKRRELFLDLLICLIITLVLSFLLILCSGNNTLETSKTISQEQWSHPREGKTNASQESIPFSSISTSMKPDVDEFIAAYYKAGRKKTGIFNRKDAQDDLFLEEELNSTNVKYLAQREKLIDCVLGMYRKFGFTGTVIGLTGISLIIWFGVATLCEFIKYLILRFFGYVVSRLV